MKIFSLKGWVFTLFVSSFLSMGLAYISAGQVTPTAFRCDAGLPASASLQDIFQACTLAYLPQWGIVAVVLFVAAIVFLDIARAAGGYDSWGEVIEQRKSSDGNNSPSILFWGGLFALALAMAFVPFNSNYLINLAFRIPWLVVKGLVANFVVLYLFGGVKSIGEYVELIHAPGTDEVAIGTVAVFAVTALMF